MATVSVAAVLAVLCACQLFGSAIGVGQTSAAPGTGGPGGTGAPGGSTAGFTTAGFTAPPVNYTSSFSIAASKFFVGAPFTISMYDPQGMPINYGYNWICLLKRRSDNTLLRSANTLPNSNGASCYFSPFSQPEQARLFVAPASNNITNTWMPWDIDIYGPLTPGSGSWDNVLKSISVSFPGHVAHKTVNTDWACSEVFATSTVARFGTGSACTWTSGTNLKIKLAVDATQRTDSIEFIDNINVNTAGTNQVALKATTKTVSPPGSFPSPASLQVDGPEGLSIGKCSGLQIGVKGGSFPQGTVVVGAPVSRVWSLQLVNSSGIAPGQNFSAGSVIATSSARVLQVPHSQLPANSQFQATYTQTLWFGAVQTVSATILKTNVNTPDLSLPELPSNYPVNKNLRISASAKLPSCPGDPLSIGNSSLSFLWTIKPAAGGSNIATSTRSNIVISPYALTAGTTYTLKVRVTTTNGIWREITRSFTTGTLAPLAAIAGGDRTVWSERDLTLDGSRSRNPNVQNGAGLSYQWACMKGSTSSSFNTACGSLVASTGVSQVVPKAELDAGYFYRFKLTVSVGSDTASDTVIISPISTDPPFVSLIPPLGNRVVRSRRVVVTATAAPANSGNSLSFLWSSPTSGFDLTAAMSYTGITRKNLVIKPSQIPTSISSFQLQLAVTEGSTVAYAKTTLNVNSAPSVTGVAISSTPASGTAMSTKFSISVSSSSSFSDPEGDTPLSYQLAVVSGSNLKVLGTQTSSTFSNLFLPSGSITVRMYAIDSLGARDFVQTTVSVSNPSAAQLESLFNAAEADAAASGDSAASRQMVQSLAAVLSDAAVSNGLSAAQKKNLRRKALALLKSTFDVASADVSSMGAMASTLASISAAPSEIDAAAFDDNLALSNDILTNTLSGLQSGSVDAAELGDMLSDFETVLGSMATVVFSATPSRRRNLLALDSARRLLQTGSALLTSLKNLADTSAGGMVAGQTSTASQSTYNWVIQVLDTSSLGTITATSSPSWSTDSTSLSLQSTMSSPSNPAAVTFVTFSSSPFTNDGSTFVSGTYVAGLGYTNSVTGARISATTAKTAVITFPVSASAYSALTGASQTPECVGYDETSSTWLSSACTTGAYDSSANTVECSCAVSSSYTFVSGFALRAKSVTIASGTRAIKSESRKEPIGTVVALAVGVPLGAAVVVAFIYTALKAANRAPAPAKTAFNDLNASSVPAPQVTAV